LIWNPLLAAKVGEKPEENRQNDADDETSDDREVEGGVFAAVDDIAGEAAEAEWETAAEIENRAGDDGDGAEEEEGAAEFAERVHKDECKSAKVKESKSVRGKWMRGAKLGRSVLRPYKRSHCRSAR
jgi:hypothetical protein